MMINVSSDPLLAFDAPKEGSKLSLDILKHLRATIDGEAADIEEAIGLTIMLPHDLLHHMPEEEITHLRDLGITIVLPEDEELARRNKENGPLVIGAGPGILSSLMPAALSGWNENDFPATKIYEPSKIVPNFGPTPSRRGG
jgi:hypothetical protein